MKIFFIPFNKKSFFMISIIVIMIILILMVIFLFLKTTQATFKPIYEADTGRNEISLTCNVVWGTEFVPPMLDILKGEEAKMTFFIGGKWAEDHPELLKRIFQEGHEIGNHGYDHKKHSQLNDSDNTREILDAENVIKDVLDLKTTLFAPPYGDINDRTVEIAKGLGYEVIMWNIDTIDWKIKDPQAIHDRVVNKELDGGIVLMHPTDGTVKALPLIIKDIKAQNVSIVTISELIKD